MLLTQLRPTVLEVDNIASIDVSNMTCMTKRSNYIHVWFHHIQDKVREGMMLLRHFQTATLQADIFTNAISKQGFKAHTDSLRVSPYPLKIPTAVGIS